MGLFLLGPNNKGVHIMKELTYSKNIANAIKEFLINDDWHFSFDEKRGVFKFGLCLKGKIKKIDYLIRVRDDEYIVYAISPIGANENNEKIAKIGFKAPSARCLSTTAPEFEHHFHATKHQGLIIVLAQSNCDESNWRFCNDKLSRNFAVKQSPVQSANH